MGGSTSVDKELKIDRERWSKMTSKGEYDVMWDKAGEESQLYKFILDDTTDIVNEISANKFRATVQGNHVRVLGAESTEEKVGMCGKVKHAEVLTERIPTLLCDSRQLSFQESNIVLYNSLKGYSELKDKFGPVEATDHMIGFNSQGQTKVWVNENFGLNHPISYKDHDSNDLTTLRTTNNQQRMVQNIMNLVERKCERGQFPEPFRTDIYRNNDFNRVLQFISMARVVPVQALDENRVVLSRQVEQIVQAPPVRQTLPPPIVTTSSAKPINSRISFNYVSPGMK